MANRGATADSVFSPLPKSEFDTLRTGAIASLLSEEPPEKFEAAFAPLCIKALLDEPKCKKVAHEYRETLISVTRKANSYDGLGKELYEEIWVWHEGNNRRASYEGTQLLDRWNPSVDDLVVALAEFCVVKELGASACRTKLAAYQRTLSLQAYVTQNRSTIGNIADFAYEVLSYMPKDSSVIVSISVARARTSGLFKKYREKIMSDTGKDMAAIKNACGIDMMVDMSNIVFALGKDHNATDDTIFGMEGHFDQKKIEDCVIKMGGKVEGNVLISPDGEPLNTYWAANDTILVSKGHTSDVIKSAKNGSNAKQNRELMDLIDQVDSNATLWVAGMVPAEAAGMMGAMGKPPKSGYLSLELGSGVDAKVGLLFNTEDEAKGMSTMLEMVLQMGKQQEGMGDLLEDVSSTLADKTMTINASFSDAQLDQLAAIGSKF